MISFLWIPDGMEYINSEPSRKYEVNNSTAGILEFEKQLKI